MARGNDTNSTQTRKKKFRKILTIFILIISGLLILLRYLTVKNANKPNLINGLSFTSPGNLLYANTNSGLFIWNTNNGNKLFKLKNLHRDKGLTVSEDEKKAAFLIKNRLTVKNLESPDNVANYDFYASHGYNFQFAVDSNNIIHGTYYYKPIKEKIDYIDLGNEYMTSFSNSYDSVFRLNKPVKGASIIRIEGREKAYKKTFAVELLDPVNYKKITRTVGEIKLSRVYQEYLKEKRWPNCPDIYTGGSKVFIRQVNRTCNRGVLDKIDNESEKLFKLEQKHAGESKIRKQYERLSELIDRNSENIVLIIDIKDQSNKTFKIKGRIGSFAVSPDGSVFAFTRDLKRVEIYDADILKMRNHIDLLSNSKSYISDFSISRKKDMIAVIEFRKPIEIKPMEELDGEIAREISNKFNLRYSYKLKLYNLTSGKFLRELPF